MENMKLKNIVSKQRENANNAHVAEHKCEYEHNKDAHKCFSCILVEAFSRRGKGTICRFNPKYYKPSNFFYNAS